ncbi:Lipopolysaccharide heptosyltransferase II [uncultured Sporomusa sp.]|uniref:lipopolysaccharide heptosyltransferase II n=1 Tax=uncultured Sporomusa sp. TaxID=307249 RepID=A0A212M1K7_9FIRM|nr:lipopolysaccharide heptosyltransferase II [uncultured Sporomusa sp.]SCM83610.1 Lipopolysaccharide heptosyltransferase II [uncultured Sporomusa sp.]
MNYRNILIVKLSAIGDCIHALPVASALKACYPQARITWVVEKPAYDLLTNNPNIDEIIIFDKAQCKTLGGFFSYVPGFVNILRKHRFDLALDLQGLFKSAAITYLSGASQRLVYCNAREFSDKISKKICGPNSNGHVIDRYLDVVRAIGCHITEPEFTINITEKEVTLVQAIAKQAGLDIAHPYVVLIPGTNWPNKCWPPGHFAQLAEKLFEQHIVPVFVGTNADKTAMDEIIANMTIPPVDLTGKTTLKQLAYIFKNAKTVVAGDTGPMHLAAAVNTPVIALFGPTDPQRNGPYGKGHITLMTDHTCQGCWQRKCPEGKACLDRISANKVFEMITQIVGL